MSDKSEQRSPKAKILIVENDVPVAMQIVAALTQAGCDVKAACSGKKGMALATTKKFDLIVLDMDLPTMNSFEICVDLKQRHISKLTPIVFLTAAENGSKIQCALEAGVADVLKKPLDKNFVRRLLGHIKNVKIRGLKTVTV